MSRRTCLGKPTRKRLGRLLLIRWVESWPLLVQCDAKRPAVVASAEVQCRRVSTTVEFDQCAVNEATETLPEDSAQRLVLLDSSNCLAENLYGSRLAAAGERRYDAVGARGPVLLPNPHRVSQPAK